MPESKTSARRVLAREREREAVQLRIAGASYDEIARHLGIRRGSAHRIVQRVLARLSAQTGELAEEVRRLELERLDALWRALYERAVNGDLPAVDRALHIMERRARLLGLDAPTKVAPTDPTGEYSYAELSDEELIREIAKLARAIGAVGAGGEVPLVAASAAGAAPAGGGLARMADPGGPRLGQDADNYRVDAERD